MLRRVSIYTMFIIILMFSLAAAGCGPEEMSVPGLSFPLPDGWAHQMDGTALLVASQSGDLQVPTPDGPRIWVHWVKKDGEYPAELVEEILMNDAGRGTLTEVVAPPVRTQVNDVPSTAIDLQTRKVRQRYVVTNPGGEYVYTFVLEAPVDRWDAFLTELESILATVTFEEAMAP